MRSAFLVLLLVGCGPVAEDDLALPDAAVNCVGGFQIVAPVEGLHYTPHLDVLVDSSEIDSVDLQLSMVDELGNAYAVTATTRGPNPTPGGLWNEDRDHYELAPSHRYTLTVTHCDTVESVTFFTSAE